MSQMDWVEKLELVHCLSGGMGSKSISALLLVYTSELPFMHNTMHCHMHEWHSRKMVPHLNVRRDSS